MRGTRVRRDWLAFVARIQYSQYSLLQLQETITFIIGAVIYWCHHRTCTVYLRCDASPKKSSNSIDLFAIRRLADRIGLGIWLIFGASLKQNVRMKTSSLRSLENPFQMNGNVLPNSLTINVQIRFRSNCACHSDKLMSYSLNSGLRGDSFDLIDSAAGGRFFLPHTHQRCMMCVLIYWRCQIFTGSSTSQSPVVIDSAAV